MKAVIMAGGEGTRLRPLTSNAPKPMLPIANVPMMQHVINLLKQHGFDEIVVTVAFLANAIKTYFGDGSEFGVTMHYAHESTPLGTASTSPVSRTRSSLTCTSGARSPISSRKIVEPSASSNRPICRARAPVNAPFSRPKSSLSMSVAGMAAQLTRTIGRPARGLSW